MTHLNERIAEFVFEELSPSEMSEARQHLAECVDCRDQVSVFQQTHAMLKSSPDLEPPRRIIFESEKPAAASWAWRWLSPAGAALAASLLTAFLLRPAAPTESRPAETAVLQQSVAPPAVQPVDYDRIINEIRASQEAWLAAELQKRDAEQSKEIQRVKAELAFLGSLQLAMRKETMENATSIQLLANKSDSQE